jgi:HAD superfamily hydrolase (TIGR01549 family)
MLADSYDAVLFDLDGVLAEPTDRAVIRWAVERSFLEFGVESPRSELVERIVDGDLATLETVERHHGIDQGTLWQRRERNAVAEQCAAIRRGEKPCYEDVAALDRLAMPLGVVSNNQHETVEFVLDFHDLTDRFRTAYGRFPTLAGHTRSKPEPYYLRQALSDLGVSDALFVGDSDADLVAAERAGVDAALLRRAHRRGDEYAADSDAEFESLTELVDELTGVTR